MKAIVLIALLFFPTAFGAEKTSDADAIVARLQLRTDAVIVSADGLRIQDSGRIRSILSFTNKRESSPNYFKLGNQEIPDLNLSYQLKISSDNSMTLEVIEFAKMDYDQKKKTVVPLNELRREIFTIKNFSQVSYIKKLDDNRSAVVRFTPDLTDDIPVKLTYVPMVLSDAIVSDNSGRVWNEGFGSSGEVSSFTSPYGTIYVSFTEFSGSKELGTAKDQTIILKLTDRLTVRVRSSRSIAVQDITAKVFGIYLPNRKGFSQISSMPASSVKEKLRE